MSNVNQNVKKGPTVYTAGAAVDSEGLVLGFSGARTVNLPTSTRPGLVVALAPAASGAQVEVDGLRPGEEVRLRTQGSVSAGGRVELVVSGGDAGKVQALNTGTLFAVALEDVADEGLGLYRIV